MDVEKSNINLLSIIIIIRVLRICWWRKRIILILLRLELLIISIFTTIITIISLASNSSLLLILAIIVTGSSLGLSLLVSISHLHNSSNSYYINMLTSDKNSISLFICCTLVYNNQPSSSLYNYINFNNPIHYHKI